MKKILTFIPVLFLIFFGSTKIYDEESKSIENNQSEISSESKDSIKYSYKNYTALLYYLKETNLFSSAESDDDTSLSIVGRGLDIMKNGKIVFSLYNYTTLFPKVIYFGKDITGDGVGNAVIQDNTMGAHCCYELYILELSDRFREVYSSTSNDEPVFKDIDRDGVFEIIEHADLFDYWHNCHADSPLPEYILRYVNGKYRLAFDLMKKSYPQDTLNKWAKSIEWNDDEWTGDDLSQPLDPFFFKKVILLIFTGNSKTALEFIENNWPKTKKGKELFINDLFEQLQKFEYWSEMKD